MKPMTINDLTRWIVEHGADKPAPEAEVGIPLYLPVPEIPAEPPKPKEISYEIDFS